jgi:hypothetical protein
MAKTDPKPTDTEKRIKLLAPHEHAGREYQPGAKLTLPADSADWLIAQGKAEPAAA